MVRGGSFPGLELPANTSPSSAVPCWAPANDKFLCHVKFPHLSCQPGASSAISPPAMAVAREERNGDRETYFLVSNIIFIKYDKTEGYPLPLSLTIQEYNFNAHGGRARMDHKIITE